MSVDPERDERLQIYKLHSELADRISQRREGANRLHVSLFAGLLGAFAVLTKIDGSGSMEPLVGLVAGAFGSTLAISWLVVIRSYRQLNRAKFGALEELEKELSFPFFTREWQLLRGYRRLSVVETVLPWMLLVLSGMLSLWAGYSLYAD